MIGIVITLIIVGVLLYLINNLIPMDSKIALLINVVVILFVCLWLLQVFGISGGPVIHFPG